MGSRVSTGTLLAALVALSLVGPARAAEPPPGVAGLAWMAGCWQGEAGEECWLAPRGGMMLGVNRGPARGERPPAFELLRIVERDGRAVFLAQPGGRCPETAFPAVEMGDARVVFANPEHDFPQRITYWRDGETLHARVEARQQGEWRGFQLRWGRASWGGTETRAAPE